VPAKRNMSWGRHKLLQIREEIRPFIWTEIGDGSSIFTWSDNWCSQSPLRRHINPRDIHRAGFHLNDKLVDLFEIVNGCGPQLGMMSILS